MTGRMDAGVTMHELAITQSVVETVLRHTGTQRVTLVRLQVGRLTGVVPEAMEFCFELATEGTPLHGATLEIERPVGHARCRTCQDDFDLPDLIALCPCGSADVEIVNGRELQVLSVDVA
ncbi:MAG TPA: hydrogenase maturation nickel metallochaperone HypA [Nocardioidaceae bacterium]|nr:hydrogenase maturation nickel metallochaperone HypA [Nocardioidaceae bacterium]